jgi:hypothetical protein
MDLFLHDLGHAYFRRINKAAEHVLQTAWRQKHLSNQILRLKLAVLQFDINISQHSFLKACINTITLRPLWVLISTPETRHS